MRTGRFSLAIAALALAGLSACVPRAEPPPPMPPPPAAPRPAPPAPPPAPPPADWSVAPLSPGDWHYRPYGGATMAAFEDPAGSAIFALRCDPGGDLVLIRAFAPPAAAITIRTSYGERALASRGNEPQAIATVAASDPLLDQIAFSRGRFLVQASGVPDLILPAWPEPARVIEDCRG